MAKSNDVRDQTPKHHRWPAYFLVILAIYIIGNIILIIPMMVFGENPPLVIGGFIILGLFLLFMLLIAVFITGIASLTTYYKDAKSSSDWEPHWILYSIGQLILSPVIVAPIYLFQRWRYVGLDLSGTLITKLPLYGDGG